MSAVASPVNCQSSVCPNGNPVSRLECPTCNKLGIRGSFFCGQECFKSGWKTHKIVHQLVTSKLTNGKGSAVNKDGTYDPFPDFSYTGALRPVYPLSPTRVVPAHIPRPDYAVDGVPRSEMREGSKPPRILNKAEQEKMRTVCRMGREILDIVAGFIKPGVTTDFLDEVVHNATIERNAYPSPLNYHNYPKSVCTLNEVICHGIPDQRKLRDGDIINIDVSVYYDGFHGDLNETYAVGEISDDARKLIRTTRESLDAAIKICKPGALYRDIGKAIEPVARANGCAVVRNYIGHGVHELFHCVPNIPHYANNKAVGTMKEGHVFTIEPMLNFSPHHADVSWPDDWTATTTDGHNSAQFEETLLITKTGVEVLTKSSAPKVY